MILSSQHLSEVVTYVRSAGSKAGAEQRKTARMEINYPVRLLPLHGLETGPAFTALTRDISNDGVGLFTSRPMRPGESYVVRLPRSEREFIFVLGLVRYCGLQADGLFTVGFRFSRVLDPEAMQKLQDGQSERERISSSVLS